MYGAFLLAVYNQEAEEFQSISKIGTGFSEEQLKLFSEQLKELLVPSPKPYYRYPRPCAHSDRTMERQNARGMLWKAATQCDSIHLRRGLIHDQAQTDTLLLQSCCSCHLEACCSTLLTRVHGFEKSQGFSDCALLTGDISVAMDPQDTGRTW